MTVLLKWLANLTGVRPAGVVYGGGGGGGVQTEDGVDGEGLARSHGRTGRAAVTPGGTGGSAGHQEHGRPEEVVAQRLVRQQGVLHHLEQVRHGGQLS